MKPIQPVTLFLFSDKIMVVKRPSYETDGLDLCGLDQRMYEGSERKDFSIRKEAVTGKMKFIGWASLNDIDIHDFPSSGKNIIRGGLKQNCFVANTDTKIEASFSSSFTLSCNNSGPLLSSPDTDQTTQRSLEAYFQHDQQRHSFALNFGGNSINRDYFQTIEKKKSHFIHQFGKAKNNLKTSGKKKKQGNVCYEKRSRLKLILIYLLDELIQSSYCQWNGHHFFANIYPTSRYHKVSNKVKLNGSNRIRV
jgi:hypothetical protein